MDLLVAMQRYLWLSLAQRPDKEKLPLLDAPVSATGLFGVAERAMRDKSEAAEKDSVALRNMSAGQKLISCPNC